MKSIDLNCDMGESYGAWKMGADAEVMPHISSANVACGFHGGDPATIRKTVRLALDNGVAIGAHGPGAVAFAHVAVEVDGLHLEKGSGPFFLPSGKRVLTPFHFLAYSQAMPRSADCSRSLACLRNSPAISRLQRAKCTLPPGASCASRATSAEAISAMRG